MVRRIKKWLHPAFLGLLLAACGSGVKGDFNRLLVELAASDGAVSRADWQKITDFIVRNKADLEDFYADGHLNEATVKTYIADFFSRRRPSIKVNLAGIAARPLRFRFFLEQSGSMTAYASPRGDGSFEAAIRTMRNSVPGQSVVEKVGEKDYTDFRQIFDELLNHTEESQISVLVTDLIYSVKDMQGVNPQKVFNEERGMVDAVFKSQVGRMSLLVVRMNGSYNGPYYAYDGSMLQYDGRRPYYIVIAGTNESMRRLTEEPEYAAFAAFAKLRGYERMHLFTTGLTYTPAYSFVLSNPEIRGRFRPERGQGERITSLTGVEPDKDGGEVRLALAVDLGSMLLDPALVVDPSAYRVEADDSIRILKIRPIAAKDKAPAERKYLGQATHIMVLGAKNVTHSQAVRISLINRFPAWAVKGSADDDLRVDGHTTFGLRYLLEGIDEGYRRHAAETPCYFNLELRLSD